jgi:SAM-dependent methyltransferase
MAGRGATVVAVDELPEHLEQCVLCAKAFGVEKITPLGRSAYNLRSHLGQSACDLILLAGVLYHASDMLSLLCEMRCCLKEGAPLLIDTWAINDFEHSYANFGRFIRGAWWQPTALCIIDLCSFAGFGEPDVRFYEPERCLVKTVKPVGSEIPFTRGMPLNFGDVHDKKPRPVDLSMMAPAPRH